jgi:hypothetical protein
MGIIHRPSPDWASHIPVLVKALENSSGPVLELGMGMFSTPILHALCADQGRALYSYDNDSRFTDMFKRFNSEIHKIELLHDWLGVDYEGSWGVALVDQKPAEARKESIKRLIKARYVIIHDTQDPIYDYESVYPLFKYRYNYEKQLNWTGVLSNTAPWPA